VTSSEIVTSAERAEVRALSAGEPGATGYAAACSAKSRPGANT